MDQIAISIKEMLHPLAEISASILEFVGIMIIIIGSFRAMLIVLKCIAKKEPYRIATDLGRALSLALEFKMGAEIIKTVIIHNLEELAILGIVIIIRALLAFIIHWEIQLEEKATQKVLEEKRKETEKE